MRLPVVTLELEAHHLSFMGQKMVFVDTESEKQIQVLSV